MRRFQLERDEDVSDVSGVGVVAQGVEFDDGSCAMRWLSTIPTTTVYASTADVVTIHGHGGLTRLVWLDDAARPQPVVIPGLGSCAPHPCDPERLHNLGTRFDILQRLENYR